MNTRTLFAGLALLGAAALPVAAQAGDPPPWAGVSHQARYHYVYYPAYEIYYAPASRYWYWREGAHWRHAYGLPAAYAQIALDGIQITLGSSLPYHYHHHVVRYYPAPQYRASTPWHHRDAYGHGYRDHNYDHDRDRQRHHGGGHRSPFGGPGHTRGPGHFESHGYGAQRREHRYDRGRDARRDEHRKGHQGRREGR